MPSDKAKERARGGRKISEAARTREEDRHEPQCVFPRRDQHLETRALYLFDSGTYTTYTLVRFDLRAPARSQGQLQPRFIVTSTRNPRSPPSTIHENRSTRIDVAFW